METKHRVQITARDRVLMAWEDSMEMVRDYENWSHELQHEPQVSALFDRFAKEEGVHASRLLDILHRYEGKRENH